MNAPNQLVSWTEKTKNNNKWFKESAAYFISTSRFALGYNSQSSTDRLTKLYNVYNNQFPTAWFNHIVNPLSAEKEENKAFPAKIRPVSILRTNIDLLASEYPRRPFVYQVNNLSSNAYSHYEEGLTNQYKANITKRLQLFLQQEMIASGLLTPEGKPSSEEAIQEIEQQIQNMPTPEEVAKTYSTKYRDLQAIKGQKWLTRAIAEHKIKETFMKLFKDWLIAGEVYTYKSVENDTLVYRRVSPFNLDYSKSERETYIEDGSWVVHKEWLTVADVVKDYYEDLTEDVIRALQIQHNPQSYYNLLTDRVKNDTVPVIHATWKGYKKIKIITRIGEDGAPEELEVDEDYVVDKATEMATEEWVTEWYEATLLGNNSSIDDSTTDTAHWVRCRPVRFQRNIMNNFSASKGPYNGKRFSDTHSVNISVLEMGLPYAIMYIILTYKLEMTIAKSKGKIMLLDQNAIPKKEGWDEEKFFYYAEGVGYALLDRNQIGVDKSWNQYSVLDMGLFDHIAKLIDLQQHYKNEWDDILGINRQRKGQTYASDLVGVNERATFQSTIMTDSIFNSFEQFIETELNGMLDLSKFTELEGKRKLWNNPDGEAVIFEVNPEDYCSSSFGVFVESSADAIAKKNKLEQSIQALIQNGAKASTVATIIQAENVAAIMQELRNIEEKEAQMAQQSDKAKGEQEQQMEELRKEHMEYELLLKTEFMHEEYNRKEDIEYIRGDFNTYTFKDGDSNMNNEPDAMEVQKHQLEREKFEDTRMQKNKDREQRKQELDAKLKLAKTKQTTKKK